jgi:hypothetical protein
MKILKMIKFDKDDSREITGVVEKCNMAASFFFEDPNAGYLEEEGLKPLKVLAAGHAVDCHHFDRAIDAVQAAQFRLNNAEPSGIFPAELKEQYIQNLKEVRAQLEEWRALIAEGDLDDEE